MRGYGDATSASSSPAAEVLRSSRSITFATQPSPFIFVLGGFDVALGGVA
jgi:hypothetical protein